MAKILYGCELMVLYEIDPETGEKYTTLKDEEKAKGIPFRTPQQAGINPQFIEGGRQEIRGGDGLVAAIKEPDNLVSIQLQFTNAELPGDALAMLAGGTYTDSPNPKYTAPAVGATVPAVIAELYVARYGEGSQTASSLQGYRVWTFNYVKGRIPSHTAQDRNFLTPQFTIKCSENHLADPALPIYSWKDILANALPDFDD